MKQYILYILQYLRYFKRHISLHVFFSVMAALSSLFSIALVIPFLGILIGNSPLVLEYKYSGLSFNSIVLWLQYQISGIIVSNAPDGKNIALLYLCIGIGFVIGCSAVFKFLSIYFLAPIRTGISKGIRAEMYQSILKLPLSFFTKNKKGQIISKITNDVREIELSVVQLFQLLIQNPVIIAVYLVALFMMNSQLTLIMLVVFPPSLIVFRMSVKRLRRSFFIGMKRIGIITSVIDETIYTLKTVRAFNAESKVERDFNDANDKYSTIMTRFFWKRQAVGPLSEVIMGGVLLCMLWYGGTLVISENSDFKAQEFLAYIMLFIQLTPYGKSVAIAITNINMGITSLERIRSIFKTEFTEPYGSIEIKSFTDNIAFRNVSFSYANDKQVLSDINLKINKGETIAFVGQSGAGKTTLVDLLPRFYDCNIGEILIDSVNMKEISPKSIRELIGYVNQEPLLFNDTVLNNLRIAKANATEEEILAASKTAHAHEFIETLPDGYDTVIGERGLKLSGGQKQRLTIARAILKNPPILILDEATSALDTESEKLVKEALDSLMRNRTSLVVAHRLSTIIKANKIFVLDKGQIVEQGNHQSLIEANGFYKRLFDLQIFD